MSVRVLQGVGTDIIEYSLVDGSVTTIPLGGSTSVDFVGYYNEMDQMVYWVGSGGARVVKWNPHTNTIVLDANLSANGTFLDVVGEYIWFSNGNDGVAVKTIDFTLAFTMLNMFVDYQGYSFPLFAPGGRVVMQLISDLTLRLLTSTGGSSFSDQAVTFPTTDVAGVANSADLQRPYIYAGDKMFVPGAVVEAPGPGGILGGIIDLGARTTTPVLQPSSHYYIGADSARWDAHGNTITLWASDSADGFTGGVSIDVAGSTIIGAFGKDPVGDGSGFSDQPHPMGNGQAIIFNGFGHAGIFDLAVPSPTPLTLVGGTDFLFNYFNGFVVVPSAFTAFWHEFVISTESP